ISQEGRRCDFRVSSTSETVDFPGAERTIEVTTGSTQCRWTAAADVPWITIVAGREGSGIGAVTFRIDAVSGPPRTGTLTVAGHTVSVAQGTGCGTSVGTTAFSLGAAGGTRDIPVIAPPGCAWTAQSQTSWISITTGTGGNGPGTVGFRVDATEGPARTGTLTIGNQRITVTQSPGCTYPVAPARYSAPAAGGPAAVTVNAAPGCGWGASSAVEWISVTAGQSGNGPGELRFNVAANSGQERTGALRIADSLFTITQASGCTFSLSRSRLNAGAAAGAATVEVAGASGCAWSAATTAPWITITGGAAGTGSGQVQFSFAANHGPARDASLSVGGQTLSIAQASGCTYGVGPGSQEVGGGGGSSAASVTTGAGCPWTASSAVNWISIMPASGAGPTQVSYTVGANQGPPRSGTLTIAGQVFTIRQGSPCTWLFAPPSHSFGASGGGGNVLVIVSGACTWTASSDIGWITMTAGGSGTGNGLVQFVAAPNTGPARTGSLTIAGERYEVIQAGP
ncbi:MAG: hypothetical protein M3545_12895, partial [Acidobacteriota bacterium]|nr:hypothetical protein [Acidobacteriota bacterium]